jgi:hypothetical protein
VRAAKAERWCAFIIGKSATWESLVFGRDCSRRAMEAADVYQGERREPPLPAS